MTAKKPLFRPEVLDAKGNQWMGELSIVHPLPLGRILGVATALVLLLAAGAAAATFRQYVAVSGVIVPSAGVVTLHAPVDGVISFTAGDEGVSVRAGDALVRIDSADKTAAGDVQFTTDALLRSQKQSLLESVSTERSRLEALREEVGRRKKIYTDELGQIHDQLEYAITQTEIAAASLARVGALREQKLVSAIDHARAQSELLTRRSTVSELKRQILVVRRQIEELRSDENRAKLEFLVLEADLARRALVLDQQRTENEGRAESVVHSPYSGVIGSWGARVGEHVAARKALLTIIPADARLEVHLSVPSHAVGRMRVGHAVSLACDAFPYQQFGRLRGRIVRISPAPLPSADENPEFRAVVAIEGDTLQYRNERILLRPGMTVQAEVETRRSGMLMDWFGTAKEFVRTLAI
jgi:membrane fusion protein